MVDYPMNAVEMIRVDIANGKFSPGIVKQVEKLIEFAEKARDASTVVETEQKVKEQLQATSAKLTELLQNMGVIRKVVMTFTGG